MFGRSLSINPYLPRAFDFDFLPFVSDNIMKLKSINNESDIPFLSNELGVIIADTTLLSDISLVATLRRYLPYLIIHKDIFISKYQILESAVYGADMIVLDASILDFTSFEILFNFASSLGLRVILDSIVCADDNMRSSLDFVMIDRLIF